MSDAPKLDAIELAIRTLEDDPTPAGRVKLQRLYIDREREQEAQFKASIARRAKLASNASVPKAAPKRKRPEAK